MAAFWTSLDSEEEAAGAGAGAGAVGVVALGAASCDIAMGRASCVRCSAVLRRARWRRRSRRLYSVEGTMGVKGVVKACRTILVAGLLVPFFTSSLAT